MIDQNVFFIRHEDHFDFWCWSRKEYNETDLRQLPITLNFREEIFTPFSTSFFYNQTSQSIKCNSPEEWARNWIDASDLFHPPKKVPCSTNVVPVVTFTWDPFSKKL